MKYVLFAACRCDALASEVENEYGALTYYLCECLEKVPQNCLNELSCREVYLEMLHNVSEKCDLPVLQLISGEYGENFYPNFQVNGNIDWQIFGTKFLPSDNYFFGQYFNEKEIDLFAGFFTRS